MDIVSAACDMVESKFQAEYAVKLIKMAQEAEMAPTQAMLETIKDTAEISEEAMMRCLAEINR